MKNPKDIYKKIDIPEPRADLEEMIINQAQAQQNMPQNKFSLPKLAMVAACFVVIFNVLGNNQPPLTPQSNITISSEELFYDVEFFEEDNFLGDSFYDELS